MFQLVSNIMNDKLREDPSSWEVVEEYRRLLQEYKANLEELRRTTEEHRSMYNICHFRLPY